MHETRAGSTATTEPRDDDRWAPHVVWWYVGAGAAFTVGTVLFGRTLPLLALGMSFWAHLLLSCSRLHHRVPFWMRSQLGAAQTVIGIALVIIGLAVATAPIGALWAAVIGIVLALAGVAVLVTLAVLERRADVRREIERYEAAQRRLAEQRDLAEDERPM